MKNPQQRTTAQSKSKAIRPTHEEIAMHAEVLWRARGCPHGQDQDIWLQAERQLVEDNQEILAEGKR